MSEITEQIAKIKDRLAEIRAQKLKRLPKPEKFISGGFPAELPLLDEEEKQLKKKLVELEEAKT